MSTLLTIEDYLKSLAERNPVLAHSEEVPSFFCYDLKSIPDARKKNNYVMFLHGFVGEFGSNRGDSFKDNMLMHVSIWKHTVQSNSREVANSFRETHTIMTEIVKMIENDNDAGTHCELLKNWDLNEVKYKRDVVQLDGYVGTMLYLPFSQEIEF